MSYPMIPRSRQPYMPAPTGNVTQTPTTHGTAHFMAPLTMLEKGFLTEPTGSDARPPLGFVIDESLGTPHAFPVYGEAIHSLLIGPTGTGKTTQFLQIAALSHGYGIFFNDPKGEIYHQASGFRRKMGRRQLLLSCAASSAEGTDYINPLETIRMDFNNPEGGDSEQRDTKLLVQLMSEEPTVGDHRIWEIWRDKLSVGCIIHLLSAPLSSQLVADDGGPGDADVRERSFEELSRLLSLPTSAAKVLAANMIASTRKSVKLAGRELLKSLQGDTKRHDTVQGFASAMLDPWLDKMVQRMTYRAVRPGPGSEPASSTVDFADLRTDADVYLVAPALDLQIYKSVQRTLIGLAVDVVARHPPAEDTPAVHFLLDEFPQLGRMAPMENWILFARGYGILFTLFVQDRERMEKLYPGSWVSFETSCNKVYFAVADTGTAEHVSRHLGDATVQDESHAFSASRANGVTNTNGGSESQTSGFNSSSGPQGGSSGSSSSSTYGKNWSVSHSQTDTAGLTQTLGWTGRALMTVDEILTMGGHEAIVLVRGQRPMKVLRIPFYKFSDLIARASIEPPRLLPYVNFMKKL